MPIHPKLSGIVTTSKLDNTQPEQLKTVAGVVQKILTKTEKEREKARKLYSGKKEAQGKPSVKPAEKRTILIADNYCEPDPEQDEYVLEVEILQECIEETLHLHIEG